MEFGMNTDTQGSRIPPGARDRAKFHLKIKKYPAAITNEHNVRSFKTM